LSHEIRGSFEHTHHMVGAALDFFYRWLGQLGYAEGHRFLENRKALIMSVLRIYISALWRRYPWFESMRSSHIDLDPKVDRAALEAVSHRLRTVNGQSRFLFCFAFVAIFLAALADLTLLTPV
jgi:hypothetical protein